jgi:hypothetical protein
MLAAKPRDMTLSAKPRLRLNHCETRLALDSISEPCPRKRSAPKPAVSASMLSTRPKATAAAEKPSVTPSSTRRTPKRSIRRPT